MAPNPTPTPAPSGGNDITSLLNSLNAAANGSGSGGTGTKTPDLYGLGAWKGQTVNPGDLPITVNMMSGKQGTTADNIVQAFAHGSPDQIATIQHALMMAGTYYPKDYTPKYGVLSSEDVKAFTEAVKTAGQGGQSVSDLLASQASSGAQLGVQAAQQQAITKRYSVTGPQRIALPNTQDLEAEAQAAFQKILGRNPTPDQQARFAAWYRSMAAGVQRANDQAEFDALNPPVNQALANADPGQVTQDAQQLPTTPMAGPFAEGQPRTSLTSSGEVVQPMMGPVAGARPMVDAQTGQVVQPSFSDRIGGLMSLGQAVASAQQTPGSASGSPPFVMEDSMPSANVAAENFARNTDPHGAAANDLGSTFQTFLSLISKNFG